MISVKLTVGGAGCYDHCHVSSQMWYYNLCHVYHTFLNTFIYFFLFFKLLKFKFCKKYLSLCSRGSVMRKLTRDQNQRKCIGLRFACSDRKHL